MRKISLCIVILFMFLSLSNGIQAAERIEVYDYNGMDGRYKINYTLFDAENFTGTRMDLTGNLTIGQKITFAFGEMIDNIVDGWIRVTGNLNVTNNLTISSLTEGSILFIGQDGLISENNDNFFWNDSSQGFVIGGNEASETVGGVTKESAITTHSQGGMNAFDIGFHRHSSQSGTFLGGFRSRGSEASESIVQAADNLLDIIGLGFDGTDYEFSSSIMFEVDGTPGNDDMPGRVVFLTTPDGSDTLIERMRISSDGNVNISNNLIVNQNLTVLDTIFLDSSLNHFIKIGSDTFNSITDDAITISHIEESPSGEITFLLTSANETTAWYQSGRNNSYSGHGNSQGIIPNYWGEENFTQDGVVNMSQLSSYPFICEFFNQDCIFTSDTRGRGGSLRRGGPLLFSTGDLEIWGQTHLIEGILSRGPADFIMNGNTFDIFDGSLHLRTPRIQLVGFVFGDNVTILSANFDGDVLTPFSKTTSGGGAAEWTPVLDVSCNDDLCARALGGSGSPVRGMSSSFSSIFLDNLNLTFFITSTMSGSDNFTITTNNNIGSGEVLLFTTSTDLVDIQQSVLLPSSMNNVSSVTLTFNFSGNNQNSDLVFIDNVLVIGNATATTEANITVFDSDIEFGAGTGDGITYQGDEAVGFSVMNLTADIVNVNGNTTFNNVVETFLNVTTNAVIQENLDVGGNITASNITADWINASTDICIEGGNCLSSVSGGGGSDGEFNSTSWNRSGTDVFLANSGDNVGIGTTSPNAKLDIVATTVNDEILRLGRGTILDTQDLVFNTPSGSPQRVVASASGTDSFEIYTGTSGNFSSGDWQFLQDVFVSGNVGIGTTEPKAALQVNGDATLIEVAGSSLDIGSIFQTIGSSFTFTTQNFANVSIGMLFNTFESLNIVSTESLNVSAWFIGGQSSGDLAILATGDVRITGDLKVNGHVNSSKTINASIDVCITGGNCLSSAGGGGSMVLISTQTASNDATIEFTTGIDSTYVRYIMVIDQVTPATDARTLRMRVSEDSGSTWKSGASDYQYSGEIRNSGGGGTVFGSTATFIQIGSTNLNFLQGSAAGETGGYTLNIVDPSDTTYDKVFHFTMGFSNEAATLSAGFGSGMYEGTTNAINGLQFFYSSGNIESGTFSLYGVKS